MEWLSRTELLLGEEAMGRLAKSCVAVFGVGGVGSFAAEALARAGVGSLVLVDPDVVCLTNLNRQIHATRATLGQRKTEAMRERILSVNPAAEVETISEPYLPGNAGRFFGRPYDYVVDAVDTVAAKIDLVLQCRERGIPIISSMGAGNKLDPSRFEVMDIYRTAEDPLARAVRKRLKEHGVRRLKVVCSREPPRRVPPSAEGRVPGSISFVPSAAGLLLAAEVVRDLACPGKERQ